MISMVQELKGERYEIAQGEAFYPDAFELLDYPPKKLYLIGNPGALQEGLAIVGARKATPYGVNVASHFAKVAAELGINIISGGALGCDSAAHRAALEAGGRTVVFLGGGCDRVYPKRNFGLFQDIINSGGAVLSENVWDMEPLRQLHRLRNRLIATLSRATMIVEAGLPSGTFTTADDAIAANRELFVVPGAITSSLSRGSNRLLLQGAHPIIDDESFVTNLDYLFYDIIRKRDPSGHSNEDEGVDDEEDGMVWKGLRDAIRAEPMDLEEMRAFVAREIGESQALPALMIWLAKAQAKKQVIKYATGRYGSCVLS